jgi:HK97 family phage major capsid protein
VNLTAERERTLSHAKTILNSAKAADRDLTDTEQKQIEDDLDKVKTLDKQIKGRVLADSVKNLWNGDLHHDDGERPSVFTPEAKDGITNALRTGTSYRTEVPAKALVSNSLLPSVGTYVQPGLHPTSQFPLASLFPEQPADGPLIRYYRMTAGTADLVNEAAPKGDAGIAVTSVDLALDKIAATAQVSTEMQMDAGFVVQQVENELQQAILARENKLIVDSFGTTSGVLTGTGPTANVVDLVAAAIASMEGFSGLSPVAVIANPTVVSTIRQAKASGSGEYIADPLLKGPTTVHGVNVVSTPATAAGTAWIVTGPGVIVYRRGGVMVNIGTNADDLIHNLSTIVAEEWVGVAVTRPSSLYQLNLT